MGISFWIGYLLSPLITHNKIINTPTSMGFSYQMGQPQSNPIAVNTLQRNQMKSTSKDALKTKTTPNTKADTPSKTTSKIAKTDSKPSKITPTITQNQKKPFNHSIVNTISSPIHALSSDFKKAERNQSNNQVYPILPGTNIINREANQALPTANTSNSGNDQDLLSDKEWKAYLGTPPKKAHLEQLYQSLKAGKVSESFYYNLIQEYLQTNDKLQQSAAFYLLGLHQSATAFEILFEIKSNHPTESEQLMSKYNSSSNLVMLAQILNQSSNEELVTFTLKQTLLIASKEKIFEVTESNTKQNRPLNTNKWAFLINALKKIESSNSSDNGLLANQVLQHIETSLQVAMTGTQLL